MATAKRRRRTKRQIEVARRKSLAARKHRLKTIHHMTLEEYDAILAAQDGVCYLCGKPGVRKYLAVDHDHKIAREQCDHPPAESCRRCWRGLLHGPCNSVLAHARDDPAYFERCISYLVYPPAQGDRERLP